MAFHDSVTDYKGTSAFSGDFWRLMKYTTPIFLTIKCWWTTSTCRFVHTKITREEFKGFLHGPLAYGYHRVSEKGLNPGLLQGRQMPSLLKLYLHSETVVCRMLILIGLEMTYCSGEVDCHGPEGRTRAGWGSEVVRTVIGKGCLWFMIYMTA